MKNFLALFLVFLIGCEKKTETPPQKIYTEAPQSSCEFPEFKKLEPEKITPEIYDQTLNCARLNIDQIFQQVRGSNPEEISLAELKVLYREKLLKIEALREAHWDIIEQGLKILDAQGMAKIKKQTLLKLVNFFERHRTTYLKIAAEKKIPGEKRLGDVAILSKNIPQLALAAEEGLSFISSEFKLSYADAHRILIKIFTDPKAKLFKNVEPEGVLNAKLEAAWYFKSLFLPDPFNQGLFSDLRGDSLKKLLKALIDAAREAEDIWSWMGVFGDVNQVPSTLVQSLTTSLKPLISYFSEENFTPIPASKLAFALQQFMKRGGLAEAAQDLVNLTQRMSYKNHSGMHADFLLPLLQSGPSYALNIQQIAVPFQKSQKNNHENPQLWVREALNYPILYPVIYHGELFYPSHDEKIVDKSWRNASIYWQSSASRSLLHWLSDRAFDAYDLAPYGQTEKDGKIPFQGKTDEDIREILDLIQVFLRFMSFSEAKEMNGEKVQEPIPSIIALKPSAMQNLLQVVSEEWLHGGIKDGALDKNEFYGLINFYRNIQASHQYLMITLAPQLGYAKPENLTEKYYAVDDYSKVYFKRLELIKNMNRSLKREFFPLSDQISKTNPVDLEKLLDGLIEKKPRTPLRLTKLSYNNNVQISETLLDYVPASGLMPVVALFSGTAKIMQKCDIKGRWNAEYKSEEGDDQLSWKELDCLIPPVLKAARAILDSGLVDLDPGVFDLARALTNLLQRPGVPIFLAKIILINGSISKINISPQALMQDLAKEKVDFDSLKKLLKLFNYGKKLKDEDWKKKLLELFDLDHNGEIQGEKEWAAVFDFVKDFFAQSLEKNITSDGALQKLLKMADGELLKLALAINLQSTEELDGWLDKLPLRSSPSKIFSLLAEILERDEPLTPLR